MKKRLDVILISVIFLASTFGLLLNIQKQKSIDRSKIPMRLEEYRMFQRWITKLKNDGMDIEADEFQLKEENEIYNTTWMKVYSIEDPKQKTLYDETMKEHENIKKVVFSQNKRFFVDYRNIPRGDVLANEVRLYGLKEDKIIDAKILDCSTRGNCFFDRAYFLDNDVFVVSEFSRNINKKDPNVAPCLPTELCSYTVKVHLVDMIHNTRLVYESEPFDAVLSELIYKIYEEKIYN